MADNSIDVATGASNLNQDFNEHAVDPSTTLEANRSVGVTASAELQVIQEAEQALGQHDDRWRQISERLSNRPQAAPTLDRDGAAQRSVAREYTEYRREWTIQREVIEVDAIRGAIDVRASGTTLTKEFSSSVEQGVSDPVVESKPRPAAPEKAEPSRFQRDFLSKAPDVSRTNDR